MTSTAMVPLPEKLGEIRWKFNANGLPYETYAFSQSLVLKKLKGRLNVKMFIVGILLAICICATIIFAIEYWGLNVYLYYEIERHDYSGEYDGIGLIISHYIVFAITLLGIGCINKIFRSRLLRKFYQLNGISTQKLELSVGHHGFLVATANAHLFTPWEQVASIVENKHGLFLLTKHCNAVAIPSDAFVQVSDKAALIDYLQGKLRH